MSSKGLFNGRNMFPFLLEAEKCNGFSHVSPELCTSCIFNNLDVVDMSTEDKNYRICLFLKYILLIMLLQLSHFFLPFIPLHPAAPLSPAFLSLSSCPWVVQISSLTSTLPILFFTSPCLFCTYHLCFLFPVPFPPFSPLPFRADKPPCDLHFCDSGPVLVVCFNLFLFLFQVQLLIFVSLLSFYCSYFLSSFS